MEDLFKPLTRDERQEVFVNKWVHNKGKGTAEWCTGSGKTITAIKCCKKMLSIYPNFRILIVVPTEALKNQWIMEMTKWGIFMNSEVIIINSLIKHNWNCDILILDELHRYASEFFSEVFNRVKYKCIIGLTATLERLDGRHTILEKYCPIIDSISLEEALYNGWVSKHVEYKVYIDVDNIEEYKKLNSEFLEHYNFFNYDFKLAMSMIGKDGYKNRLNLCNTTCKELGNKCTADIRKQILQQITAHSMQFSKTLQARKKFINNHPEKLRLTQLIIDKKPNSKIITFSANTEMAENIDRGFVYTGKDSKKKSRMTIEEFSTKEFGVLNTIKKANEGLDIVGLDTAIILGMDSSKTTLTQRKGRVVRFSPNKKAEIFTLVIRDTVEEQWFTNSHENTTFVTIDEEQLMHILNNEPFVEVKTKPRKMLFRF